jgi:hypothetical protein
MSVWDNANEKIAKFHTHLDECEQCRNHPFELCSIGASLLHDAAIQGEEAIAQWGKEQDSSQGTPETIQGLGEHVQKQISEIVKKADLLAAPSDDVFWKRFNDRITEKLPNVLMALVVETFLETCMKDLNDRLENHGESTEKQ